MDDWKDELRYFFRPEEDHRLDQPRAEASRFMQEVVLPAFQQVARELEQYGREVRTSSTDTSATVVVRYRGRDELRHTLEVQITPEGLHPLTTTEYSSRSGSFKAQRSVNDQTTADLTADDVARECTREYLNSMRNRS